MGKIKSKNVVRVRKYKSHDEKTITSALSAIAKGLSIRKAASRYGISKSTLNDKKLKNHPRKNGRQTVLSEREEKQLIHGLKRAAKWGFPFTALDIRYLVKGYLDLRGKREKRFTNNFPGYEWSRSFLTRHGKEITARFCENIKRSRAAVSKQTVSMFFEHFKNTSKNVPPSNIVNYDETNLSDDPGRHKVIVKRGIKHPERVINSSKVAISIMMAGAADGHVLPTYVVYKSEYLWDSWISGGPPGCRYNRNSSGWFDLALFEDWFFKIALKYFKTLEGPKILIGDNLSSHISLRVISECENHDIQFVLLPPNSTHLLQPLDVAFFRPLKIAWRGVLSDWKKCTDSTLNKDAFPSLLKSTLEKIKMRQSSNIQSGFKATGLYPYKPECVLQKLPDYDGSDSNNETEAWTTSFEEMLKEVRQPKTNTKGRKKKINVPAGKSISGNDFQKRVDSSNDSTSESSSSSSENIEDGTDTNLQCEDQNCGETLNNFEVGDFVTVEYKCARWKKVYVGQIKCIKEDEFDIRYMRPHRNSKRMFIFPDIEDRDTAKRPSIIRKHSKPFIKRGLYTFGEDVF